MITLDEVKYVRDREGFPIRIAKAAAELLKKAGLDIYSDEAAATMHMYHFHEKAARYARWKEMAGLIEEFGPLI